MSDFNEETAGAVGKLALAYWRAVVSSDDAALERLISDDFFTEGSLTRHDGKKAFMIGVKPVQKFMADFDVLNALENAEEAALLLDMITGPPALPGRVRVANWFTARDGKLTSSTMLFNGPDMRKLIPDELAPPPKPA